MKARMGFTALVAASQELAEGVAGVDGRSVPSGRQGRGPPGTLLPTQRTGVTEARATLLGEGPHAATASWLSSALLVQPWGAGKGIPGTGTLPGPARLPPGMALSLTDQDFMVQMPPEGKG